MFWSSILQCLIFCISITNSSDYVFSAPLSAVAEMDISEIESACEKECACAEEDDKCDLEDLCQANCIDSKMEEIAKKDEPEAEKE